MGHISLLGFPPMESASDSFLAALPDQKGAIALRLRDIITELHRKTAEIIITNPKRLLEGTGKDMRHVRINSKKDINKKQIICWTKGAIKLNAKNKLI